MAVNDGAIGTGGAALARGRYWLLLAGAFIVYASANAVVPIAEELRALLGRTPGGAGVFLAPFATGFGIGCLVWFLLARTRPARLVLPLALAVTGLGGLLSVLALGEGGMMWGRLLAGLGAAGYPAAAQALIATGAPSSRRGQMIGGFITAVVAGSFIGQALVGALAELSSARLALVVVCTIAPALAALALWHALPAAPDARRAARVSYVPPRAIAPAMAVALLAFAGYWLLLAELPAALRTERYGLGAAAAGTLSLLGLLGAVTALVAGRVADRRGQRLPATVTLIIGVAGLTLTLSPATPLWLFAVGYGLFLAAYWALLPPATAEVAGRVDDDHRQAGMMAFYTAMWLGAALTPALSPLIDSWRPAAILALGAWVVAAAITGSSFTHRQTASDGADRPTPTPTTIRSRP